jgi:type VI secretion system protein ImpH
MERLLGECRAFSFVQTMRLLRRRLREEGKGDSADPSDRIRVRPELSLAFPGTDVTAVDRLPEEDPVRFLVTATFLGLYGTSSPLPTFYTEDLLREREDDRSITRDFLDVINASLYPLFFQAWSKYRLHHRLIEEEDPGIQDYLFSLLGLESTSIRQRLEDPYRLLRYMGLTTQIPRSAEGLRALLSDSLGEESLRIVQCVERKATVPGDQRLRLGQSGHVLGEETVLGQEVSDRMGRFRVEIGPCDGDGLHRLLPDGGFYALMQERIRFYLDQPLEWDLEVLVRAGEIRTAAPGNERWSRLGWNTWVFSGPSPKETWSVRLAPAPFEHPQSGDGPQSPRRPVAQEVRP